MNQTSAPRNPALQFTISDLLWVILLTALALFLSLAALGRNPEPLAVVLCVGGVLLVNLLGALLGIWRANRGQARSYQRYLAVLGFMVSTWLCVGVGATVLAAPLFFRSGRCPSRSHSTAAAAGCKAFAEAQEIYRRTDYDGDGVLEYSQSIRGTNSLVERVAGTADLALLDRTFGAAEGPPSANPAPKAGYCFKVLTAQGASAPGGARCYVDEDGNMTKGYAVIAYPAVYDQTGRDCFIINNNGTIFQKDLGKATYPLVEAMTEFNPDSTWAVSE